MLLSLTLMIVLGLTAFDQGPVGAALRHGLVQAPARMLSRLSRLSRGQRVGIAVVVLLGLATVLLFEAEGLRLFSMAAPDLIAWVLMFDVTVVFDLVVLTIGLGAVSGWRGMVRQIEGLRGLARRLGGRIARTARARGRRVRRPRPPRPGSDDVEPGAVFA
ncbi:MAG: hypothetical protein Q7J26_14325 [Brevundimonas sp.]|uniref:hypothetical protein n=1 Tax=Brevundimonas sp. TaxID=1871086 RepID=UPI002719BD55|nr:hypothetical protein [Brevundimonas sp.]MDO9609695.1 hypothetical protein [Brevundimonas sp.]